VADGFPQAEKGDEFSVLMSREMLDGKREQSQLLGVRLRSDGKDYYAIRAEDGKFYDRNGTGWRKASCASRRRNSSASPLTLTRVV
jgi:murein DD-endopeptidase